MTPDGTSPVLWEYLLVCRGCLSPVPSSLALGLPFPMLFGGGGALAQLQQGVGGVVLEEGLQEHAYGAKDTDEDEDP